MALALQLFRARGTIWTSRTLGLSGINILGISTSISSISSVILQDQLARARNALATVFEVP